MAKLVRIGEAAARVGLTPKALRLYDRLGLVSPSSRSPAGYRLYSGQDLDALRLLKTARDSGLPLGNIRPLLPSLGGQDCGHFRARAVTALEGQLRIVGERIKHLRQVRKVLEIKCRQLQTSCRPLRGDACGCGTAAEATLIPLQAVHRPA